MRLGENGQCAGSRNENKSGCTMWGWALPRPGGTTKFLLYLTVHDDPQKIEQRGLQYDVYPKKSRAMAPELERIAVVSSPVMGITRGMRADERLNEQLMSALRIVEAKAAVDGWIYKSYPNFGAKDGVYLTHV